MAICKECGKEFEPTNNRQKFCKTKECLYARRSAYMREYRKKEDVRIKSRKAKKLYMQRKRAEKKGISEIKSKPLPVLQADNYAERQKMRTLELVGKIDINL